VIHRKESTEIYQKGEPAYGISPYDELSLFVREDVDGAWWVYAEKRRIELGAIESLSPTTEVR
jgi:hypothetical protein